jgi:E3 ubiquitin-protein ligase synoviolin
VKSNLSWLHSGKPNFQLFFAFECAILVCKCLGAAAKYCLAVVDAALHHRWPSKGLYVLYTELFVDVVHFFLYATFFVSVLHVYRSTPYHLLFDLYSAYRTVFWAATNYLRFRTVMSRIGTLNIATAEDIERVGGTCIICRDDMVDTEALKKLACGHVFHLSCLQSWLERQQTCPICRSDIFRSRPSPTPEPAPAADGRPAVDAGVPADAPQAVGPSRQHVPGRTEAAREAGGAVTDAATQPLLEGAGVGAQPWQGVGARGLGMDAGPSWAGVHTPEAQQAAHLPHAQRLPLGLLLQVCLMCCRASYCCKAWTAWSKGVSSHLVLTCGSP